MDHRLNRIRDDAYRKGMEDAEKPPVTPTLIKRLQDAVEGECEGLAIEDAQAEAILRYVLEVEG